jgi:hypothetical protein
LQGFQKLGGARRACNLQSDGATIWLYRHDKTQEAAALSFRVDRLSRCGKKCAGSCKPPPKTIWEGYLFNRLRQ